MASPRPASSTPERGTCPVHRLGDLKDQIVRANPMSRCSLLCRFGGLLLLIAVCEGGIMVLLTHLPPLPPWQETAIDVLSLTLLLSAPLWLMARRLARQLQSVEHAQLAARTAAILATAVDGIIVTDAIGRIQVFNRGAEQIFGYSAAEAIGRSVSFLVPERLAAGHDALLQDFAQGISVARAMHDRNVLPGRRKDGSEVPVEIAIAKSGDREGATLVAIVRDVSERQRIEAELRTAKEQAEAGARAKSEFLANMSHEIRTPMNAVIGLTDLLHSTPLTTEQREYVDTIRTSGDSLLTILNDILDFSKIEAGCLTLEEHAFSLRECVESSLELMAPLARRKRLDLLAHVEDEVPSHVIGDSARLRQILLNLTGNALKFTEAGEVFVRMRLTGTMDGRSQLQVDVRDTGIGIPPDRVDRLFRSFSQVDSSTTRRFGGTGLGLAISRRLIELMGGAIWVESTPGAGSTFSFRLSLPTARGEPAVAAGPAPLAGRRILVVDDNLTNRRILAHWLRNWAAEAILYPSAADALAGLAEGLVVDAALLDLHMPVMDGAILAERIKSNPATAGLPLILLSSSGPQVPPEIGRFFHRTLGKPTKPTQLLRCLQSALGGTEAGGAELAPLPSPQSGTLSGPARILVADDNAVNRRVVEGMLGSLGHQVTFASNGLEALDALERGNFNLVFMDVQMPEMDGLEATRRLRSCSAEAVRSTYVVALTANAYASDRAECLAAGMNDFLAKPFRLTELRAVLGRAQAATRSGPVTAKVA